MTPRVLTSLERFLLPNACVACGATMPPAEPDGLVCAVCRSRLRRVVSGCPRCQQPLPPVGPCRFCADWTPALAWTRSGFWLEDVARTAVHHLKYEDCRVLGDIMGQLLASTMPRPTPGWLVPIPLASRRMRTRGYNQTQIIAQHLGARWQMPVAASVLHRVRETNTQTALTPEARLANVAGAFVAAQAPALIRATGSQKRQAILVDDVLTTGATLDAAASALSSAGWPVVGAVTFARAMPFEARLLIGAS